jgi:hypothetical protein
MARELDFFSSVTKDTVENVAINIWKVCPFRIGNRAWMIVLFQSYCLCCFAGFLLACVLNSVEGKAWIEEGRVDGGPRATGDTALDECLWFVFTTMHGIAFGEFHPRYTPGHIIAMLCCVLGYWFPILLMSIVLLSQLPGEKAPTLGGTMYRMISAVWPSYVVFIFLILAFGSQCGPYIHHHRYGVNEWPTGIYFLWTVAHRMPFGDVWPNTVYGRTVTIPAAMLGLLYMPYTLALIAVRCPSIEQHESLLGELRKHPEDSLGRGYIVPDEALRAIRPQDQRPRETELSQLNPSSEGSV